MKDLHYQNFTGYGISLNQKGNILFKGRNTFCTNTREMAYCAAQMSICVFQWLQAHTGKTTVNDLLKELDTTTI